MCNNENNILLESLKTITVLDGIKNPVCYIVKFKYFINMLDLKKKIQQQIKNINNEHIPIDNMILISNSINNHFQYSDTHTFLNNIIIYMIIRWPGRPSGNI